MRKLFLMLLFALVAILFFAFRAEIPARFQPQIPQSGKTATEQPDPCHHAVTCGGITFLPGYKKIVLPYNIWGYVEFRVNGKTHFTRAKRMIPKGTVVWEDAFGHIVLERCGNGVTQSVDVDPTPVVEPSDIFPSVPPEINVVTPTTDIPPTPPQPPSGPVPPGTPPSYPPAYPTPPCCGNTPPVHVPEPSGFVLTLIGIFVILCFSRIYKGRKKP